MLPSMMRRELPSLPMRFCDGPRACTEIEHLDHNQIVPDYSVRLEM